MQKKCCQQKVAHVRNRCGHFGMRCDLTAQSFQNPSIEEYTLNHNKNPHILFSFGPVCYLNPSGSSTCCSTTTRKLSWANRGAKGSGGAACRRAATSGRVSPTPPRIQGSRRPPTLRTPGLEALHLSTPRCVASECLRGSPGS